MGLFTTTAATGIATSMTCKREYGKKRLFRLKAGANGCTNECLDLHKRCNRNAAVLLLYTVLKCATPGHITSSRLAFVCGGRVPSWLSACVVGTLEQSQLSSAGITAPTLASFKLHFWVLAAVCDCQLAWVAKNQSLRVCAPSAVILPSLTCRVSFADVCLL